MIQPVQKPGRSKQDYGTPPELLKAVRRKLGIMEFDCDLAATAENAVADEWAIDAFALPHWRVGLGWNWLNPPFAKIGPWVERAQNEANALGAQTAVLIPAAVGSNWWRDHVHHKCMAVFLNPRVTFVGCKDPYPKDCALLLYGWPVNGYDVWTWKEGKAAGAVARAAGRVTGGPRARKALLGATETEANAS